MCHLVSCSILFCYRWREHCNDQFSREAPGVMDGLSTKKHAHKPGFRGGKQFPPSRALEVQTSISSLEHGRLGWCSLSFQDFGP